MLVEGSKNFDKVRDETLFKEEQKSTKKISATYESLEMTFEDIEILYSQVSAEELMLRKQGAINVVEKFNFGLQLQFYSYRDDYENTDIIPETIVNLVFHELNVNYDRAIVCQVFKLLAFINYGSWNQDLSDMTQGISKVNQIDSEEK